MAIKGKKRKAGGVTPISTPTKPTSSSPAKGLKPPSSPTPTSSTATSPNPSPPSTPLPGPGSFPATQKVPSPRFKASPVPPKPAPPPPTSLQWLSSVADRLTQPAAARARPQRQSVAVFSRLVNVAKRVLWYFLVAHWYPVLMVAIALAVSVPVLSFVLGWYRTLSNLFPALAVSSKVASALLVPFTSAASLPALFASSYCSTIGIGCSSYSSGNSLSNPPIKVGLVARKLREEASRASDIFQSVVELSDLDQMGLHQVEIWELAMAVKRGSKLQDKEILSSSLSDLGDLTRDMKDKLIGINSEGINSFSWIVHEFTRLENSLLLLAPPPPPSSLPPGSSPRANSVSARSAHPPPNPRQMRAFQTQLTSLITHLSTSLTSLQNSIEQSIPLADRASRLGGQLQEGFFAEELLLETKARRDPVWLPLVGRAKELALGSREEETGLGAGGGWDGEGGGWRRSEGVKRDLKLTRETVGKLGDLRRGMEDLRSELVGYRDNVGWFRAGVVGWYLGGSDEEDEGMDPELEMEGLRGIIEKFSGAVQEAKSKGRVSGGGAGSRGAPPEVGWGG